MIRKGQNSPLRHGGKQRLRRTAEHTEHAEKEFFRVFRVFRGKIWVLLFKIPRDFRNRKGL